MPAVTAVTFGHVTERLKSAKEVVIVGTALIVAGGVLLNVARLHALGWTLLVVGILLLVLAALSLAIAGLGPVVRVLRPATLWKAVRHWNPFVWCGSPIGWRGFPGHRAGNLDWREFTGVWCACYYTANAEADVTKTVRDIVDDSGHLHFQITNGVFIEEIPPDGDPEYGIGKELAIDYVVDGVKHSATFKENETVDLQVGT